ncbi:MAG: hydroxymethylpyrimidine/phosphomethylpyrimidine kinase [Mesorhizobium sp.]|uniref:hydroxymethylpyrimidine/phosphomethylpyrimidine kinase n=1 Tax=Mesorhizobium sp. TaxID=1871066 RepID=UPI000FE97336|nr:hydroxymethylpyrimidine/phosphomethylpyrimidine kinase [Mesorhizobium sp.]RWH46341.1 MAG: hydroxymethylpyrimidine/phosphomethylpyrimidine kinase [Mesorhizobium sp.]
MAVRNDPHVLVVAGSDSSGGAGIARDIETLAVFGLRACVTVTAVTVQTHDEVRAIQRVSADLVAAQMRAAFDGNLIAAVKIGMLGTKEVVEAVASVLKEHPSVPAVLDPVLAASSGRALADDKAVAILKHRLLPLCCVVTPNLPELAVLAGTQEAADEQDILEQAGVLLDAGAPAVLAKGGHAAGESVDLLLRPGLPPLRFAAPRLNAKMRGTGCSLSSALAAKLAFGAPLDEAARDAKKHVLRQLHRHVSGSWASEHEMISQC